MAIQWYPGHMHKASKEMKAALPQVDLIIEVLDARIPFSSQNPMLAKLRGNRPSIKILNKMDLADPQPTQIWQTYLERKQSVKTLAMVAQQQSRVKELIDLCHRLLPEKVQRGKQIQAMIVGIPNVGKSTLINALAGRRIAKTGNEPAVTKTQQRIKLDQGVVLLDTPGVLWPNLENPHSGYRLAITGAIKETAIDNEDIALYAVDYMLAAYPARLEQRFELDTLPETGLETMEVIGRRRGCLRAGGRVDLERVAKIILTEIRAGMLGPLSWETPEMVEKEWEEVLRVREQKTARKAARKLKQNRR